MSKPNFSSLEGLNGEKAIRAWKSVQHRNKFLVEFFPGGVYLVYSTNENGEIIYMSKKFLSNWDKPPLLTWIETVEWPPVWVTKCPPTDKDQVKEEPLSRWTLIAMDMME